MRLRDERGNDCAMNEMWTKLLGNKWLLMIAAIGILLLAYGAAGSGNGQTPQGSSAVPVAVSQASTDPTQQALASAELYQRMYEQQLTQAVNQIAGVHDAVVYVFVKSTPVASYVWNSQSSLNRTSQPAQGGTATTQSTTQNTTLATDQNASGGVQPVVSAQQMPPVTGVLVLAKAADTVQMEAQVTSAVQDVLGIPSFEITVLPRN